MAHGGTRQTIGDRIKTARERLGLSQERFAEQLGTDRWRVMDWEEGVNNPSEPYVEKIAKLTGEPAADFRAPRRSKAARDEVGEQRLTAAAQMVAEATQSLAGTGEHLTRLLAQVQPLLLDQQATVGELRTLLVRLEALVGRQETVLEALVQRQAASGER